MPINITHAHASKVSTPSRIYDTHRGLHLWVKSAKAKYWIFRTSKGGRRTDLSLGRFPNVGVAEARQKASELAKQVSALGHVPKRSKKPIEDYTVTPTTKFEEFALSFVEDMSPQWRSSKHVNQWTNTLKEYATPIIGGKALSHINTEDILLILRPIWLEKTETAMRLRGRIERILAAATVKGLRQGVNPAQWKGHLDFLLPQPKRFQKVRHHPALPYKELPDFLARLHGKGCLSALALEFCILTAARTGEVINAKRSEVSQSLWRVPCERMKTGREHLVPLSNRANQVLEMARTIDPESDFLFSKCGKSLSNMSLLTLLKRMGYGHVTTHGFRSSFRDWVAEETNFSSEVAEMCLAHTISNKVEAAYRRGVLLEKRTTMLNSWEAFCLGIETRKIFELKVA